VTTDHPQHSTNPSAALSVRMMTHNLRDLAAAQIGRGLNVAPIPHRTVLAAAARESASFRVQPAPMPQSAA
jgi:hypothetical protein